jgi:hypothetical protein
MAVRCSLSGSFQGQQAASAYPWLNDEGLAPLLGKERRHDAQLDLGWRLRAEAAVNGYRAGRKLLRVRENGKKQQTASSKALLAFVESQHGYALSEKSSEMRVDS